ncbi:hypothetical protein CHCC20490_4148 [Bacillus paralicheniformis]|nr:hypothetical protein CHCC20490_4148 [Bacillus paralicheniformis]
MEDQIVYWRTLTCRRSQIHIAATARGLVLQVHGIKDSVSWPLGLKKGTHSQFSFGMTKDWQNTPSRFRRI